MRPDAPGRARGIGSILRIAVSQPEEEPQAFCHLLIETEQELRKVTWPTIDEAVDSSLVVAGTVMFLMTFMAGADWFLGRLARRILLGG